MEIDSIVQNLLKKKIVDSDFNYYRVSGGTSSEIWMIESNNRKIMIKGNMKSIIKYESYFLKEYILLDAFPKIITLDEEFNYLIYEYLEGNSEGMNLDICLLSSLKEIVKQYHIFEGDGYGWVDQLSKWDEFLLNRVNESQELIEGNNLNLDVKKIINSIGEISHYKFNKYLLHGDFGVHNFININGKLKGVIDPTPVVGDRIYDLIYAICSNPEFLENININELYEVLSELEYSKKEINNYLKVILYIRIGTCLKYHKEDLNKYLKLYNNIIELI